jgi:hypothetical protein
MAPYFKTWVGSNFSRSVDGHFLVLGESHYGHPYTTESAFTVDLISGYVNKTRNRRFLTNIMQVVDCKSHKQIDRGDFWNRVAFCNYIQRVLSKSNVAPSAKDWPLAEEPFFAVLDELKPRCILVLSKRLWQRMSRRFQTAEQLVAGGIKREARVYEYRNGKAVATWIPHPSYAFNWMKYSPWVQQLKLAGNAFR